MAKTKRQLINETIFIEEHSEYVYEGDYTYNSLSSFVAEHLDEAKDNQDNEIWLYCDATENDIW